MNPPPAPIRPPQQAAQNVAAGGDKSTCGHAQNIPPINAAAIVLNLIFWTLVPLVTLAYLTIATICVSIYLLFTWNRRNAKWMIRRFISRYGDTALKCAWPFVRIEYVDESGQAHLPESERDDPPFVFVVNHRAASDGYLMSCLPYECVQIMNIWPSKIPVFGQVASLASYMSVRDMPFDDFLSQGSALLKQGVSVIAFPEGTRSGTAKMGPFHGSIFRLAMANNAKIVPLAIHGNEYVPPRGSFMLRPGRITITRLPAVTPEQYQNTSAFALKNQVHDMIQKHLDSFETKINV